VIRKFVYVHVQTQLGGGHVSVSAGGCHLGVDSYLGVVVVGATYRGVVTGAGTETTL
jgi:hypothetical protein